MKQILSNDIINQYLPTLIKCPLFNKLGEPELRSYLNNAKVIVHSYKKNDFIGPKGWLSPEAMNKYLQSDNNKYKFDCNIDHQSDVFQLGKVFWYILQGNAPIGNIRRSDFFDGHDDIYSVLKYMLNHSKKKRPISIDYVINELSRIMQKYKFVC